MIIAGIPAYNEEKTIARVILQAQRYVDTVVVCDDGSHDMTGEIARKLGAIVITHDENMGYGLALQSLFKKANALNADILITLDADGQHDAREIPKLIQPIIDNKAHIAIGSRFLERSNDVPRYRRLGIKLLTKFVSGAGASLTDSQSGMRAYNRQALESITLNEQGMGASAEILLKAKEQGLRVVEVSVQINYKGLDTSTQNPVSHGIDVLSTIIKLVVEERPLVYLGVPALFTLLVGITFGIWTLQIYATQGRVITNIFLISIALTLSGMFTLFTALVLFALHRQVTQGVSMLSTIIKPVIEERPLVYLGVPALVTLLVGITFGIWTLERYSTLGVMFTDLLLISIALTLSGMFILFSAITLFAVIRQRERMEQHRGKERENA